MTPIVIGQYLIEETISQFVPGDYYELAFYGSDIKESFINLVGNIDKRKNIVICYMREPAFEHDEHVEKQILLGHDLVEQRGIDAKQIIYFYSTDQGKETHEIIRKKHNLSKKNFRIVTFPYYEVDAYKKIIQDRVCDHVTPTESFQKNGVRTFLSLNGKPDKYMRLRQVILYWHRKLLNKGLVTLTRTAEDERKYPSLSDYFDEVKDAITKEQFDKLCKNWPKSLDRQNVDQGLYGNHFSGYPFDKKLYMDTYMSVVSETHSGAHNCNKQFFPTEKIYKAIINCHPFIVLSTSGFLQNLQSMGYKTFEPFINESYDKEDDALLRMVMAIDEVEKLCNKGVPVKMLETAEYNYGILQGRVKIALNKTQDILWYNN